MWSIAVYNLGLTTDQFFDLSLRQYDALVCRMNEQTKYEDYRASIIGCTIINMFAGKGSKTVSPDTFFASLKGELDKAKKHPEMTPAQMKQMMMLRFPPTNQRH
jgi:hypothetical protein